jgi:hypothetical protein
MSKDWLYEGEPFTHEYGALHPDWIGFVYLITDTETGEMYVGQKRFHRQKTLPITKNRKRRQKVLVESDWRNYYSSSETIKQNISEGSSDRYIREIIRFGYSKGDLNYLEMIEQVSRGVLFDDKYLNGIVNVRIHQKHLSERLKRELGYDN